MRARCAEFPNDNPDLHLGAIWVHDGPTSGSTAETREIELADAVLSAVSLQPVNDRDSSINDPGAAVDDQASAIHDQTAAIDDRGPGINDQTSAIDDQASVTDDHASLIHDPARVNDLLPAATGQPAAESDPESESEMVPEPGPAPLESMVVLAAPPGATDEGEPIVVEELDFDLSGIPLEGAPIEEDGYATLVETLAAVAVAEGGTAEVVRGILEGADAGTAAAWRAVLRGEVDDISTCGIAMLDEWASDVVARAIGAPGKAAQLRRELRARGVCAFGLVAA
jgi:hypothetical protein